MNVMQVSEETLRALISAWAANGLEAVVENMKAADEDDEAKAAFSAGAAFAIGAVIHDVLVVIEEGGVEATEADVPVGMYL